MRTIRNHVFETNSSSAHVVTFATKKELDDFHDRKLIYDCYEEKLVPVENAYQTFLDYIDYDIRCKRAPEEELRRLTPTKEEFVKWVYGWENYPLELRSGDPYHPAANCIRKDLHSIFDDENFLACGYCDHQEKQKDGEDLYALSLYRSE